MNPYATLQLPSCKCESAMAKLHMQRPSQRVQQRPCKCKSAREPPNVQTRNCKCETLRLLHQMCTCKAAHADHLRNYKCEAARAKRQMRTICETPSPKAECGHATASLQMRRCKCDQLSLRPQRCNCKAATAEPINETAHVTMHMRICRCNNCKCETAHENLQLGKTKCRHATATMRRRCPKYKSRTLLPQRCTCESMAAAPINEIAHTNLQLRIRQIQ